MMSRTRNLSTTEFDLGFDNLIAYIKTLRPVRPLISKYNRIKLKEPSPIEDVKRLIYCLERTDEKWVKDTGGQDQCGSCPLETMIVAIDYLEKLIKFQGYNPTEKNLHPVFWICCTLAHKFISDDPIAMVQLAGLGGYAPNYYLKIESWIVKDIGWSMKTTEKDYQRLKDLTDVSKYADKIIDSPPVSYRKMPRFNTEEKEEEPFSKIRKVCRERRPLISPITKIEKV